MKAILGIGNALVDILATLPNDELLHTFNLPRGGMSLIEPATATGMWDTLRPLGIRHVAGGSAANTLAGTAALGMRSAFIGKTGRDELGQLFADDMESYGIRAMLLESPAPTGRCMVCISPDAERTMATCLGAAIELTADDLKPDMFEGYDYFHIEGYLVQNHELVQCAMKMAVEKGLIISLDLASYNVVADNREFLWAMVQQYVHILFANEAEAMTFTGKAPAAAVTELSKYVQIAVVKTGSSGSLVKSGSDCHRIDPYPAQAVDATGAGDLYAAGFLYAHAQDLPLDVCGNVASMVAAKVVETVGTRIEQSVWEALRETIARL